jgi:hypothetical protein
MAGHHPRATSAIGLFTAVLEKYKMPLSSEIFGILHIHRPDRSAAEYKLPNFCNCNFRSLSVSSSQL